MPKYTRGQEFIVGNLPASGRPGGTSFGYPSNISVGEQLALFGERMRGLTEYGTEAFADPRICLFEAAIESVLARGKKVGDTFYRKVNQHKATVVGDPGIEDVYTNFATPRTKNRLLRLHCCRRRTTSRCEP